MINCGTDIVKISRLEKALETPGFYEKVFGKRERAEFENAAQGLKVSPPHLRQRKHSAKPWEPEYAAFPCAKRKFCIRKTARRTFFCPEKRKPYRIKYTPNSRCRSRTTATMPRHL